MTDTPPDPASIGVCYFPEHWPDDDWERDVAAMADAGLEYVRMAEFSWGRVEPRRGEFDFDWLDEAVDLVHDHGMQAVLCTPTATPPKWLVDERPGILQADPDGTPRNWGSRRFTCFNSPAYREETERIVARFAERYAGHPGVAGWQTDNEFGCHGTVRCYCEDCADAFRDWLRERYGSIDALNEAWGNAFWSQQYDSFGAVDPPRPTPAEKHPSRLLDYARFSTDSVVDYNRLHVDGIRAAEADGDDWFVTHNFMGDFASLDAYALADDLDFLAWDSYPTGFAQDRRQGAASPDELRAGDPDQVGMNHDLYRGAKRAPFWVMEQQPGDVNWPPTCPQPGEGAMRLWAHHAVAHGADAVCYFRWRRCRGGQEQYHAGLRRTDGSPDRGSRDASEAAEDLADLDLAPVDAPVAVLHDYESLWATTVQPHTPEWSYWTHLRAYYGAARRHGVQTDVVHPDTDLEDYPLVLAPSLYLLDDERAAHLRAYVESGGHLVCGVRTGQKTPANRLHEGPAPGPLADLVGATVDQHESLPEQVHPRASYDGETYDARTWAEWLDPGDADVVGTHDAGTAAGRPAVTTNDVGDGRVTYCGVWPGEAMADALLADELDAADVARTDRLPDSVRVAERDGRVWVTNFGSDPVRVDADGPFLVGSDDVGAFDVAVVEGSVDGVDVTPA